MKRDLQIVGFSLCVCVISFILLFGLETRGFILFDKKAGLFVLFVAFIIYTITIALLYIHKKKRIASHYKLWINGKRMRVQLRPASAAISQYVNSRAHALGIRQTIKVWAIPCSYNSIDAFVFDSGMSQKNIAISGGIALLFASKNDESQVKARFIVDHELGHIYHNDTVILHLTRAMITAVLFLLPVKFMINFYLADKSGQPEEFLKWYYSQIFPSIPDFFTGGNNDMTGVIPTFINVPMPLSYIIGCIIVFSILLLILLYFFYRAVIRRREFLADAFAVHHSQQSKAACAIVAQSLLQSQHLKDQPSQAYYSSSAFHPPATQRLKNITEPEKQNLPSILSSVCILGMCFAFRFCYGLTTQSGEDNATSNLYWLSALFFLLTGGIIFCLFLNNLTDDRDKYVRNLFKRLTWVSLFTAIGYIFIYYSLFNSNIQSGNNSFGLKHLGNIELAEKIIMIFSLPIIVACFALLHLPGVRKEFAYLQDASNRFKDLLIYYTLAALLIIGVTSLMTLALNNYRSSQFKKFASGRLEWDRNPTKPLWQSTVSEEERPDLYRFKQPDNLGELGIHFAKEDLEKHVFYPPASFFILSHAPLRSSLFQSN